MPALTAISEPSITAHDWLPSPSRPLLRVGEVHVWRAALHDPRLLGRDTLSLGEVIRAERCHSVTERNRYIAARVFLRDVLSRYTGTTASELCLNEDDAEVSVALSTLRFTSCQSEDLALIAVTHAREVGVDVERVCGDLPFEELAAHFFEPSEQWSVRTVFAPEQKAWKFFDFWTTNEACSKVAAMCQTSKSTLSFHKLLPADGFLATLAVGGGSSHLALWDWR
jgi:hypothetical protein